MTLLTLTRFGNPILRKVARELTTEEISGSSVQQLIADIRQTNTVKKYGVGIAAPQVGESIALSLIDMKPTATRPDVEVYEQVIINPSYVGIGRRSSQWEGCLSTGVGKHTLFAKTLRYKRIHAEWYDEHAVYHRKELSGIVAHVFQHETDHLHGVLFVDHVRDASTYIMADEYRKRIAKHK